MTKPFLDINHYSHIFKCTKKSVHFSVHYWWQNIEGLVHFHGSFSQLKFMFFKKATKIDKIFSVDLTITTYCQIDSEDFVNFCGLLRKRELYWEVWELRKKLSLSKGRFFGSQYFARKEKAFSLKFVKSYLRNFAHFQGGLLKVQLFWGFVVFNTIPKGF